MKRFLSLALALVMVLCLVPAASADSVQDALAAAAKMTNEELYAKAKEDFEGEGSKRSQRYQY